MVKTRQSIERIQEFLGENSSDRYLLMEGNVLEVLKNIPSVSIDMAITSPPYWQHRKYTEENSIGNESSLQLYIENLLKVFEEIKRILKPDGSFWLNLGDSYRNKNLQGIPWRIALALQDRQGWIMRNDVIWNKIKGNPDNSKDKLRNLHEYLFHFVKQPNYYYDVDSIRNTPKSSQINKKGQVITATGVSGVNYKRQILRSTLLSEEEKNNALAQLNAALEKVKAGEWFDFRMVIRGQQRATHSDSVEVSGRALELKKKGYYVLPYHPKGSKPGDVWEIIPEDRWRKDSHFAPFPEELCLIPVKATCPRGGIVLDPFVGTGTSILTAIELGRRGLGIDLSPEYLEFARDRLAQYQPTLFQLLP